MSTVPDPTLRTEPTDPDERDRFTSRVRLGAACLVLVGLAMVQSPGLLVPDTKLDLATAPARFLGRAVHLWDPLGAGGQLQNQAYGYLWPMGPFFLAGHGLGVPGWAVQRSWLALVLVVAFLGAAALVRALGVRSDLACILAGFAYALSPRMLTTLGPISIEAWPSALAPWVLLPLVVGATRGSPRRAAALSAVAVAVVGGVNAAATFAVLPLGAVWLLTRSAGPRRRTMMTWWPVFTLLGTLWWLVPLVVLGAHSPPFLDYIESARTTTFSTTLFDALRGTSDWVPYVDTGSRAGNDLIRLPYLVLDSGVVLALGLVGIAMPRSRHRGFLVAALSVGLLMVTFGHLGEVQGWFAPQLQPLLDGVLAPLRNVHKFDPVVRLPLVVGLALLVDRAWAAAHRPVQRGDADARARRVQRTAAVVTAVVAVLGAASPVLVGRLTPANGFVAVPDYWTQTATWLAQRQDDGQALLAPGSSFGDYVWGSPNDEPMQALARSRWAVRNAVPLTPPGNIRVLDAVEARFAQGLGSAGLATYLRRAGVAYLVVRNDLALGGGDVPDPVLVHQALRTSPGLTRVAAFGPRLGGEPSLTRRGTRVMVNGGWQTRYRAIEVYRVAGRSAFGVQSAAPPVVAGGPEDLLDLADLGLLDDEPTLLAPDVGGRPSRSRLILTDGLRAVERNFGAVHDAASATFSPGQARTLGNPTPDYLPDRAARWTTTARTSGAASVTASSSMADADAPGAKQPGELPFAAVDGDPATAWVASYDTSRAAWWQVRFTGARAVGSVTLTAGPAERQVVRVRTEHRTSSAITLEPGASRTVRLDDASTAYLRVQDASGRVANRLALADVAVPGLQVQRALVLPDLPRSWGTPDDIVLRAVTDAREGCVTVAGDVRCVNGRQLAGEEQDGFRRVLRMNAARTYQASLRVAVRPGTALAQRVMSEQPVDVTASSTGVPDPRGSVLAAVDGDPATTWTAATSDTRPVLGLSWLDTRTITGLRLTGSTQTAARLPTSVQVGYPGGQVRATVGSDGRVELPRAVRTRQLTLTVTGAQKVSSLGFDSTPSSVPIGIGELRVEGLPYLPIAVPTASERMPCGSGPTVSVDGRTVLTRVTASLSDLYAGGTATARLCQASPTLTLGRGGHDVDVAASALFVPRSLVLSSGTDDVEPAQVVPSDHRDPVRRQLAPASPAAPGRVVAARENSSSGWAGSQAGRPVAAQVVDGWQQGWRVGEQGSVVTATFAPDRLYRAGLLAGLLTLLLLAALPTVPWVRRAGRAADPLTGRGLGAPARVAAGLLLGGLLAGWAGCLVAALGLLGLGALRTRSPQPAALVTGAAVLVAAAGYALRPWGGQATWAGDLGWPQYAVVLALSGLFVASSGAGRVPRRYFRRSDGTSTTR